MELNGPYDSTFKPKFGQGIHVRVLPPAAIGLSASCGLSSPVGGENSGSAAFGSDDSGDSNLLECRVNKCLATQWQHSNDAFRAWVDQDSTTVCRSISNLPTLIFDFSTCD